MKGLARNWCNICRDAKPNIRCADCKKGFHRECLLYGGYTAEDLREDFRCSNCAEEDAEAECFKCEESIPNSTVIICDRCDRSCHLKCSGLTAVPPETVEWVCDECKNATSDENVKSLLTGPKRSKTANLGNVDICYVCQRSGKLLGCDFCDQSFHPKCLSPEVLESVAAVTENGSEDFMQRAWRCPICSGHDPLKHMAHKRMTRAERTRQSQDWQRCVRERHKICRQRRDLFLWDNRRVLNDFIGPRIFARIKTAAAAARAEERKLGSKNKLKQKALDAAASQVTDVAASKTKRRLLRNASQDGSDDDDQVEVSDHFEGLPSPTKRRRGNASAISSFVLVSDEESEHLEKESQLLNKESEGQSIESAKPLNDAGSQKKLSAGKPWENVDGELPADAKKIGTTDSGDVPVENTDAYNVVVYQNDEKFREVEELALATRTQILEAGIKLKSYQRWGVNWLLEAFETKAGAILADEMGLGKTIQTLAFLSALKVRGITGPHLVVVPLSTVGNWAREIRRFTPHLTFTKICGSRQERDHSINDELALAGIYDVFITTYETCVTEEWFFTEQFRWQCIVLDEAHRIKNKTARIRHSLDRVDASMRVLLTGTPLQNNMRELFTLLNFLFPDISDDVESLEEVFRDDTHAAASAAYSKDVAAITALLSKLMLRRTKDLVVRLPEKIPHDVWLPLSKSAAAWYKRLLDATQVDVRDAAVANIRKLLGAVIKMRICCCHPRALVSREASTKQLQDTMQYNAVMSEAALKAFSQAVEQLQSEDIGPSHLLASSKLVFLDKLLCQLHSENMTRCPLYKTTYEENCRQRLRREILDRREKLAQLLQVHAEASRKKVLPKKTIVSRRTTTPRSKIPSGSKQEVQVDVAHKQLDTEFNVPPRHSPASSPSSSLASKATGSGNTVSSQKEARVENPPDSGSPQHSISSDCAPEDSTDNASQNQTSRAGRARRRNDARSNAGTAAKLESNHKKQVESSDIEIVDHPPSDSADANDSAGADISSTAAKSTVRKKAVSIKTPKQRVRASRVRKKDKQSGSGDDNDFDHLLSALDDGILAGIDFLSDKEKSIVQRLHQELRILETSGLEGLDRFIVDLFYSNRDVDAKPVKTSVADGAVSVKDEGSRDYIFEKTRPSPDESTSFVRYMYPARLTDSEFETCEQTMKQSAKGNNFAEINSVKDPDASLVRRYLPPRPHKVLVFTQFQLVLDELEAYCRWRGWSYMRLDGSTNKMIRELDMREFNSPDSPHFIYLISTRAGGLGINLVTANHVIMFDEDWNPFVDLQAIDRAHRIGQVRNVNIWHLISEWTVEERMVARRQHKLRLDRMLIQANVEKLEETEDGTKSGEEDKLSADEIHRLLRYGRDAIKYMDVEQKSNASGIEAETLLSLIDRKRQDLTAFDVATLSPTTSGAASNSSCLSPDAPHVVDLKEVLEEENAVESPPAIDPVEDEDLVRPQVSAASVKSEGGMNEESGKEAEGAGYFMGRPKRERRKPRMLYNPDEHITGKEAKEEKRLLHEKRCFMCGSGSNPSTRDSESKKSTEATGSADATAAPLDDPLVKCMRCPRVYHQELCLGLSKMPPRSWMCPWHECCICSRRAAAAGGLLIHCAECPTSFCFDCFPPEYRRYTPPPEFFEQLQSRGWNVSKEKFITFLCSRCKAIKEQQRRRHLTQHQLDAEDRERKQKEQSARQETRAQQEQARQDRLLERESRAREASERKAFLEHKKRIDERDRNLQLDIRTAITQLYPHQFLDLITARRTRFLEGHDKPLSQQSDAVPEQEQPTRAVEDGEGLGDARPSMAETQGQPNEVAEQTTGKRKRSTKGATKPKRAPPVPEKLRAPGDVIRLCDNCGIPRHDAAQCPFPAEIERVKMEVVVASKSRQKADKDEVSTTPAVVPEASDAVTPFVLLESGPSDNEGETGGSVEATPLLTQPSHSPEKPPEGSSQPAKKRDNNSNDLSREGQGDGQQTEEKKIKKTKSECPLCHSSGAPIHSRKHCSKLTEEQQQEYVERREKINTLVKLLNQNAAAIELFSFVPTRLSSVWNASDFDSTFMSDKLVDTTRRNLGYGVDRLLDRLLEEADLKNCIAIPAPAVVGSSSEARERFLGRPTFDTVTSTAAETAPYDLRDKSQSVQQSLITAYGQPLKNKRKSPSSPILHSVLEGGTPPPAPGKKKKVKKYNSDSELSASAAAASLVDTRVSTATDLEIQRAARAILEGNQLLLKSLAFKSPSVSGMSIAPIYDNTGMFLPLASAYVTQYRNGTPTETHQTTGQQAEMQSVEGSSGSSVQLPQFSGEAEPFQLHTVEAPPAQLTSLQPDAQAKLGSFSPLQLPEGPPEQSRNPDASALSSARSSNVITATASRPATDRLAETR